MTLPDDPICYNPSGNCTVRARGLTVRFWGGKERMWLRFWRGVACMVTLLLCVAVQGAQTKPNVILVFIDDMGWSDFSCFGNTDATTENIDALAAEGIRFEQFYVNSPICSPSRVAISTGQYPQRWRIGSYLASRKQNADRGIAQWLAPSAPMLARILHDNGYMTGHFGKWHMGGQRDVGDAPLITEYGFDVSLTNFEGLGPRVLAICDSYDGKPLRRHTLGSDKLGRGDIRWSDRSNVTEAFTSAAIKFIKRAEAGEKPFYVNLWPDDVHSPFFPPAALRGDSKKRTLYLGVLETMDQQLGVLFDYIRDSDQLRDNTLIIVCSDNGPEQGAGGAGPLRGYKTWLYEGGIRSSLVVWGPGMIERTNSGSVNTKSFFSAIDLVPSILDVSNVLTEVDFDGENVADVLLGKSNRSRHDPLYFRRPPDRDSFYGDEDLPDLAARDGRWKLLCEYDGNDAELYDLELDRGETTNVIAQHAAVAKRLGRQLVDWHQGLPQDNGDSFAANAK